MKSLANRKCRRRGRWSHNLVWPHQQMGAWLNYASICAICEERGFTDFGPYGGLPAEEAAEEGDEAVEGDIAEDIEEAIEEIVAEERRKSRQLRSCRFRNRNK